LRTVKPAYDGTVTDRNIFPLRERFRLLQARKFESSKLQILGTVEVFR